MIEPSNEPLSQTDSPTWSNTTKLIVGLSIVAIVALLLIQLRSWIGPLILAFVIAYLFYPIADWLRNHIKLPWSLSVGLIYLVLVGILLGLLTWGGIAFIEPIQNLVKFMQKTLNQVPDLLQQVSQQSFSFGPINFDFSSFDLTAIAEQLLGLIQPLVSRAGSVVGTFATGAATVVGQVFFLVLISYFILSETKGSWEKMLDIKIPGYQQDLRKFGSELSRIWNAFLRGQLILMLVAIFAYTILLSIFGMRFVLALALVAGLARFVPYIGPWVTWITYFLVALLQGSTIFGMEPIFYAILVVGLALLMDTVIDNLLAPRIFSNTLRVHPAAVLVAILISAAWLGLIGIVLAAPVLATIKLFWNYSIQKMFDRDPWEAFQPEPQKSGFTLPENISVFFLKIWKRIRRIRIFNKK